MIVDNSVQKVAAEIGGRDGGCAADAGQHDGADEREQQHTGERDQGALDDQEAGECHHQRAHGEQHEHNEGHGQEQADDADAGGRTRIARYEANGVLEHRSDAGVGDEFAQLRRIHEKSDCARGGHYISVVLFVGSHYYRSSNYHSSANHRLADCSSFAVVLAALAAAAAPAAAAPEDSDNVDRKHLSVSAAVRTGFHPHLIPVVFFIFLFLVIPICAVYMGIHTGIFSDVDG